ATSSNEGIETLATRRHHSNRNTPRYYASLSPFRYHWRCPVSWLRKCPASFPLEVFEHASQDRGGPARSRASTHSRSRERAGHSGRVRRLSMSALRHTGHDPPENRTRLR